MAGFREFLTGEVLTAANVNDFLMKQSVMLFADGAARDSALGTAVASGNALREGMLAYNQDDAALQVYDGTEWKAVGVAKEKRIERFTGSGTWTVPAGVTYAIAHILGGGGGAGRGSSGNGGNSSVAFASGTITANGGNKFDSTSNYSNNVVTRSAPANSGEAAAYAAQDAIQTNQVGTYLVLPANGSRIVSGAAVTPAASITVTVGAGGAAGTGGSAGGSGYVYIEYYEEV
jgi:hypothetical protein